MVKEKNELIKAFQNEKFGDIRVVLIGEKQEPYFVGKDVAKALGYSNTRDAIKKHVDEEDRKDGVAIYDSIGREQKATVINESGLYSLILSSKLPSAKEFKRWVTSEILPSIRKHGAYLTNDVLEKVISDPQFAIVLLTNLQQEKEARLLVEQKNMQLEERIQVNEKHVVHSKAIEATESSIPFGTFSDMLYNAGINIGQNKLLAWCRDNKLLVSQNGRRNEPTKKALDLGIIEVNITPYDRNGRKGISRKPVITPKGQLYLLEKIMKELGVIYYKVSDDLASYVRDIEKTPGLSDLEIELMLIKPSAYKDEWNGVLEMAKWSYDGDNDDMIDIIVEAQEVVNKF